MEKIEGILFQDGSIAAPGAGQPAAGLRVNGIRAGGVHLLETRAAGSTQPRVLVPHGDLVVGWAYKGETRLEFDDGEPVLVPAGQPFYASTFKDNTASVIAWDNDASGMLLRLPYSDVFVGMPSPALPCGAVARAASLMEPAKAFLEASVSSETAPNPIASYTVERLTVEMLVAIFLEVGGHAGLSDGRDPNSLDQALAVIRSQAKDPELDPALLARIMGLSLRSLHREFQSNELSVAATIRKQRVANARALMERPGQASQPLDRIATGAGFSSVVTMTRAFLASGLETPAKFRRALLKEDRIRRMSYA